MREQPPARRLCCSSYGSPRFDSARRTDHTPNGRTSPLEPRPSTTSGLLGTDKLSSRCWGHFEDLSRVSVCQDVQRAVGPLADAADARIELRQQPLLGDHSVAGFESVPTLAQSLNRARESRTIPETLDKRVGLRQKRIADERRRKSGVHGECRLSGQQDSDVRACRTAGTPLDFRSSRAA